MGFAKAMSDLSQEGVIYPKSKSWKNKWELDKKGDIIPYTDKAKWYYLFSYKPLYVEKFPYSSTFLVLLTDAWHTIESIRFLSCVGAILSYDTIISLPIDALIIWSVRTISFSITYETTKRDLG